MCHRFIAGVINLEWIFTGRERAASPDWIVSIAGNTLIGLFAIFLGYYILKKPSRMLWSLLLCWNAVGLFDVIGAFSQTIFSPFAPFPEFGIGCEEFQFVIVSNAFIHMLIFYLLWNKNVKSYMGLN